MIRCLVPDLPEASELLPWLARIDANRWYTNFGPLVREFERELIGFMRGDGRMQCVTLASGMSALELGLRALGIRPGQRVLMPALTFPATALAVIRCGAEPVFADVDAQTWTLTPAIAAEAAVHERVDLVMPVATYGTALPAADWDAFVAQTATPVLADAAAALGVQTFGQSVHWAFSLHATKPMGIGEGGLFVSPDTAVAERLHRLTNFGFAAGVIQLEGGTNAKLSEYAAAVGLAQIARWPRLRGCYERVLHDYRHRLSSLPEVTMQAGMDAPPATLCVQLPAGAAEIGRALGQHDIETRRWYLPPLYEHPAFRRFRCSGPEGRSQLPVTQFLADRLLGLPFHTRLSTNDVGTVVQALAAELDRARAHG